MIMPFLSNRSWVSVCEITVEKSMIRNIVWESFALAYWSVLYARLQGGGGERAVSVLWP